MALINRVGVMLEFIVLGIIPGTHINITLSWVLAVAAIFLIVLELRYHKQYALKVQAATMNTQVVTPTRPRVRAKTASKSTAQAKSKAKKTTRKQTAKKTKSTRAKA